MGAKTKTKEQKMNHPIATSSRNELSYRGVPVEAAIRDLTFAQLILLMLKGDVCTEDVGVPTMINALLVAWADHGEPPPSTQCTRLAASCHVPFIQAAMAGFACWGNSHGPVEAAALFIKRFAENEGERKYLVDPVWKYGFKVPGFGHPLHTQDPRIAPLLQVAMNLGLASKYVQATHDIEKMIASHEKNVSVNLAGITAALWLDMGFPARAVGLIALAGRAVGLAAHYVEVVESGASFIGTPPKE